MRFEMEGLIGAAGFASGDRVVVGHWARSPIGPMSDVMWAEPDGRRVLYAPDDRVAAFVTAIYRFDDVVVGDVAVDAVRRPPRRRRRPRASTCGPAGPAASRAAGGRRGSPAGSRARWPGLRCDVRTYGVSPSGVREWYRADSWAPLTEATARVGGRDLGAMADVSPPCRFGFSEPPKRPSLTAVRPLLEDPSGRLDQVVADLTGVGT